MTKPKNQPIKKVEFYFNKINGKLMGAIPIHETLKKRIDNAPLRTRIRIVAYDELECLILLYSKSVK
jgi:hypothetical protein